MLAADLKNIDVDALLSLRADVERLLVEKGRDLQRQIALLDGSGRVAGGKKRGRPAKEAGRASLLKGTTVPPKYRGPEGETWAGRGATPRWLKALLDEGHSIEEFAIARKGRKAAAATAKTPKKRKPAGNRGRKEKVAAGAA